MEFEIPGTDTNGIDADGWTVVVASDEADAVAAAEPTAQD